VVRRDKMDHQPAALLKTDGEATAWHVRELLERVDNDTEFFCDLLRMFREDARTGLEKAGLGLAEGNMAELSRAAHALKGMLRNLAMNQAAEAAYALEKAPREERREEVAELLHQPRALHGRRRPAGSGPAAATFRKVLRHDCARWE